LIKNQKVKHYII